MSVKAYHLINQHNLDHFHQLNRPKSTCTTVLLAVANGGDNTVKKLAQETCTSFLHQIFMQVHASSADDTSNKNGHSWTKQVTFSILSVDHSMETQNFLLE